MGNLLALEPRIMFDGAALVTGAEVVQDTTAQDQTVIPGIHGETSTNSNPNDSSDNDALWASGLSLSAPSDRKEIVFIDTRVEDYQTLMKGIDLNAEVILLDSTRDGVEQIAEILSERTDIDAIHLIAEGNEAELHLGTSFLTQEAISGRYADLFAQIGQSLSADADLLIYGCKFGEGKAGLDTMESLAELTGADIAASTDRTGHINEHANWNLEASTGTIESSIVIGEATQAAWEGVLATYTVTNTNDAGAGSLRQAIIDANANSGTDTIEFNIAGPGPHTIMVTSELPTISDAVIIDGYSQAGSSVNTLAVGNNATLMIELDGSLTGGGANGFDIDIPTAGGTQIRGLVINQFDDNGVEIDNTDNVVLQGNFIGTDVTGSIALGNLGSGISINTGATGTVIGGVAPADRNVIGGNADYGILIAHAGTTLTTVQGNYIGTDITGTTGIANLLGGVLVEQGTTDNTIGGTSAGEGNVIAFNAGNGITITQNVTDRIAIHGNSIFSNTGLGIDLKNDGVTLNDLGDVDTHENQFQNFPVLTSAKTNGSGNITIEGSINSTAGTIFRIEFFSNTVATGEDPSMHGEGETYLGFTTVNTDGFGNASFSAPLSATVGIGEFITATATDPTGNTSEFSLNVLAAGNTAPTVDLDFDNNSGATGNNYAVTFTEGAGPIAIADTDTDLMDVDSTTFASVKLAVSGLLDGNAETLVLDGNTFALATAVAGQDTIGGNYHLVIGTGVGTATISITKQGGSLFTQGETETLIKAVQYQHTDTSAPNDGDRLIDVIVNDGIDDSAAARTTINVNPVNDPPTATIIPTAYGLNEDDVFRPLGGLNVSDSDAGTNDLSVTLSVNDGILRMVTTTGLTFASGANDSATMTVTGATTNLNNALATLSYQPDQDFSGSDLLTLNVDDLGNTGSGSLTDIDTANIIVAPNNDQPTFTGLDKTPTFIEGGAAVVLDNNATIADPELDAANNYNGATLTLARNGGANADDLFDGSGTLNPLVESGNLVVGGTTIGTVTTNSGGTLVLTFNSNASTALVNSALQQITYANSNPTPPASVQVDFTINDGNAGAQGSGGALNDTGSVTVTINPINIAPIAMGDNFLVTKGSTTILNLASNDADVDDGLDLTSITIISVPSNGTIDSINVDGTVTYTHNGSATLADSFTYTIRDLAGAPSNTVTVNMVINPVNLPPVAVPDNLTVNEGSTTTLNLAGNDADLDNGLDLTSITIISGPTNGTITSINTDGTVDYAHDGSETLADSFTYTIDDLAGATSNTVTVSLTITPQNDPPVAMADNFTVNEGSTNTLNLAGNDTDSDGGLDLTSITIISSPTNGTIDSINTDGTVTYTHNGSETLADSFTYTIDDLAGATSNTVTVSLTVTPQNDPPIITSNGGGGSVGVTVISGNTAVTDVNATDAEGNLLTYSILGGADAAKFSIDPTTGVLTFNTAPDSEAPGDIGSDNVYDLVVQVSDGTTVDTQALAVTVTKAPPVVIPPPPPPNTTPDPTPPPTDGDGDDGESEDEASEGGVPVVASSPGNLPGGGQGSPTKDLRDSDTEKNFGANNLSTMEQRTESTRLGNAVNEILDLLRKPFDTTAIKGEIQAILTRWGFLQDLDRVRDAFQDVAATEQTYSASSVAASTGLSIGYVFWLLRSGVLLTALLSSLPAWQFVNPLLVLDRPEKKKRKKGQEDPEDDSVESMFENPSVSAETSETKTDLKAKENESRWSRRTQL